jgi:hypothetical protein
LFDVEVHLKVVNDTMRAQLQDCPILQTNRRYGYFPDFMGILMMAYEAHTIGALMTELGSKDPDAFAQHMKKGWKALEPRE